MWTAYFVLPLRLGYLVVFGLSSLSLDTRHSPQALFLSHWYTHGHLVLFAVEDRERSGKENGCKTTEGRMNASVHGIGLYSGFYTVLDGQRWDGFIQVKSRNRS